MNSDERQPRLLDLFCGGGVIFTPEELRYIVDRFQRVEAELEAEKALSDLLASALKMARPFLGFAVRGSRNNVGGAADAALDSHQEARRGE